MASKLFNRLIRRETPSSLRTGIVSQVNPGNKRVQLTTGLWVQYDPEQYAKLAAGDSVIIGAAGGEYFLVRQSSSNASITISNV